MERAGTEKLEGMTHMVYGKQKKKKGNYSYIFVTKGSSSGVPGAVIVQESILILKYHGLKNMWKYNNPGEYIWPSLLSKLMWKLNQRCMSGLLFLFMFLKTSKGLWCSGILSCLSVGTILNLPQTDDYLWILEHPFASISKEKHSVKWGQCCDNWACQFCDCVQGIEHTLPGNRRDRILPLMPRESESTRKAHNGT